MEQKPKVQENNYLPKRGNPLQETICYKIGGTVFEIETSCGGTEALYDKMVRLIRSETITDADKDHKARYHGYSRYVLDRLRIQS